MKLSSAEEALKWFQTMLEFRQQESPRLEQIFQYLRDPDIADTQRNVAGLLDGPLRWLNKDVPQDLKRLANMSRVNMLKLVVNSSVQDMYVDGFRAPKQADEDPIWSAWQLNGMDRKQIGIHRSALSYGASYATVVAGDPVPVIRGVSPRRMTAVYEDDDVWPELALEKRRSIRKGTRRFRLYDETNVWTIEMDSQDRAGVVAQEVHGAKHCPVVRYISEVNDDGVIQGEVEPLIPLQDQINVTTFGLLVAQHYQSFRQRYIIGWTAASEAEAVKAGAKKLWQFEDENVKVGEFGQVDLTGYINSREASLRHLATVSQTPVHELAGQLVNLSAEALAAAESGHQRKLTESKTSMGESHEQVLGLTAEITGDTVDERAEVRWRDTEARSLAAVADALMKLVQGLGVPPVELWEKIPGVTQQEVDRWKATAEKAGAEDVLLDAINRQTPPPDEGEEEETEA